MYDVLTFQKSRGGPSLNEALAIINAYIIINTLFIIMYVH